jgi:hypothetical protein
MTIDETHPLLVETASFLRLAALEGRDCPPMEKDFLRRLGCPTIDMGAALTFVYHHFAESDRHAAQTALPLLLASIELLGPHDADVSEVHSLLLGIHRLGRWQACLDEEATTYSLASALCFSLGSLWTNEPDRAPVKDVIIGLLNQWLKPSVLWKELPDEDEMVRCTFGDAWAMLAKARLDAENNNDGAEDPRYMSSMIERERPPFLPGLCPAQGAMLSVPLPDDVGYSP